ncbi:MAG: type II toxin-antitoxin system VapC family toxin [Chthoniobacterales bacterium]
MKILLDSHAVVWWLSEPERLTAEARAAIADPRNDVFVSAASVWELGLKMAKGKLVLPSGYDLALWSGGIEELCVNTKHAKVSLDLPPLHFDPFDRLLIAQAISEGMMLMTRDRLIHRYQAPLLGC